jgi:hypothetical protein
MSEVEPPPIVIQYSDPNGNITHQGVLGSNASGSQLLTSTFPTTSTGSSLGHYHYTETGTNSLQFLNASGTGEGGHQFYHSSSTEAPIKVLEANRNETMITTQFNVDKSTQGTPILIDLPDITISTNVVVVFATPINTAPWNIVGVGNPVQVNQNTANMVTGTTYYLTGLSTQLGQITTNPDGTGIIDCTDLVSLPQPILTWESGQFNPSTIQTAILSDTLEITTDTDTSILSATDLTFNGTSVLSSISTLNIKQTNVLQVYNSPAIYADGRPPLPVPSASSNTYAQFGWYFKNSFASNNKINWYMPPATGMLVSDVIGLYLRFFNCATTSNDNTPFLTIYTTPTGSGDFFPGFFKSSMTYVFDQSVSPVANTSYTMFENVTGTCPNPSSYASNLVAMEQSPVNNPRGTYTPSESILAFVIGTNSASPFNSVEFIAQKLGVMTNTGTQELLYQTIP